MLIELEDKIIELIENLEKDKFIFRKKKYLFYYEKLW